ncbi:hypothetical protein LZ554_008049 [Drepanopeziza brunnea f. sp. 'monogermtubi']|nr:hypothetical protein LZ554_008049 [Drepanopeziza brunnea f. sp. 'monogermtubi']
MDPAVENDLAPPRSSSQPLVPEKESPVEVTEEHPETSKPSDKPRGTCTTAAMDLVSPESSSSDGPEVTLNCNLSPTIQDAQASVASELTTERAPDAEPNSRDDVGVSSTSPAAVEQPATFTDKTAEDQLPSPPTSHAESCDHPPPPDSENDLEERLQASAMLRGVVEQYAKVIESQLHEKDTTIQELHRKLKAEESRAIKAENIHLGEKAQALETLRQGLEVATKNITVLRGDIERLKIEKQAAAEFFDTEIRRLKAENEDLRLAHERIEGQRQSEVDDLSRQLVSKATQLDKARGRIHKEGKELATKATSLSKARFENAELNRENNELTRESMEIKDRVLRYKRKWQSLRQGITEMDEELGRDGSPAKRAAKVQSDTVPLSVDLC